MELAHPIQLAGGSMGSGLTMSTHFSLEDPNGLSGSRSCSDISITQQVASVGVMLHVCIAQTGNRCSLGALRVCGLKARFLWVSCSRLKQRPSGEAAVTLGISHIVLAPMHLLLSRQGPVSGWQNFVLGHRHCLVCTAAKEQGCT